MSCARIVELCDVCGDEKSEILSLSAIQANDLLEMVCNKDSLTIYILSIGFKFFKLFVTALCRQSIRTL